MAKASGGSGTGGGGRPAPIPPNNGPKPAGWPSQTGKPSGGMEETMPLQKNN